MTVKVVVVVMGVAVTVTVRGGTPPPLLEAGRVIVWVEAGREVWDTTVETAVVVLMDVTIDTDVDNAVLVDQAVTVTGHAMEEEAWSARGSTWP